jgi:hypothetical protein
MLDSDQVRTLVARSAEIKGNLVAFAQGPRYQRRLEARIAAAEDEYGELDQIRLIQVIDEFILQHRRPGGRTVAEQYVAQHAHLLAERERAMLLGWADVVEGLFELDSVKRDVLMLHHLRDDLDYQVYSNAGRGALVGLKKGMFLYGRIVPVHPDSDAWLLSGGLQAFPKSAAGVVAQAAVFSDISGALRRNPDLRERSWAMQREFRSTFIEVFGADWAILPPESADEKLRELYRWRTEAALAKGRGEAGSRKSAESAAQAFEGLPPALLDAESVGLIFDEVEGLCFYEDYGLLDELFASPALARSRRYAEHLRGYLRDESVAPMAIRRLAERHPGNADQVFQAVLRKPDFRWAEDGEALLRKRKPEFFATDPQPSMAVIGQRLADLLQRTG